MLNYAITTTAAKHDHFSSLSKYFEDHYLHDGANLQTAPRCECVEQCEFVLQQGIIEKAHSPILSQILLKKN